jgi:hypothetical protein
VAPSGESTSSWSRNRGPAWVFLRKSREEKILRYSWYRAEIPFLRIFDFIVSSPALEPGPVEQPLQVSCLRPRLQLTQLRLPAQMKPQLQLT